jgi:hypothetical protein
VIEIEGNLGDMPDVLKPGEFIEEFPSVGPKNYANTI